MSPFLVLQRRRHPCALLSVSPAKLFSTETIATGETFARHSSMTASAISGEKSTPERRASRRKLSSTSNKERERSRDVRFLGRWLRRREEERKNVCHQRSSLLRALRRQKKRRREESERRKNDDDDQSSSRAPRLFDGFSGDTASFMFLTKNVVFLGEDTWRKREREREREKTHTKAKKEYSSLYVPKSSLSLQDEKETETQKQYARESKVSTYTRGPKYDDRPIRLVVCAQKKRKKKKRKGGLKEEKKKFYRKREPFRSIRVVDAQKHTPQNALVNNGRPKHITIIMADAKPGG